MGQIALIIYILFALSYVIQRIIDIDFDDNTIAKALVTICSPIIFPIIFARDIYKKLNNYE